MSLFPSLRREEADDMNKQNRRTLIWILGASALYLLLLFLLVAAERNSPNATIRTMGDAFWYSLITLTTIGYGDKAPVSMNGKLIASIFVLCSVGVLAALIGLGLRLVGDMLIPRLRLRLGKGRTWYAFSEENADSVTLAAALNRNEPDCVLIFPDSGKTRSDLNAVRLRYTVSGLLDLRGTAAGLSFFCMSAEPWANYVAAVTAAGLGVETYCMADVREEKLPACLHLFNPAEIMSRRYWTEHPLKKNENRIIFIGFGEAGMALLERALLTNVFETERGIEYHIFGDGDAFSSLHPEIIAALDGSQPSGDRLIFHNENWTEPRGLLQRADRVILCCDEDRENLRICTELKSWFASPAVLHVKLRDPVPGLISFGGRGEFETPEYVMKDELNRRAILMNEIYNEGSDNPVPWRELSPFLQQSNIAAADHLIVKARYLLNDEELSELSAEDCSRAYNRYCELYPSQADLLQAMEHRRWMRFYQMYNWRYAPRRDNALRCHPLLLPYEELSLEDRLKDAYAWEMLGRLGKKTSPT